MADKAVGHGGPQREATVDHGGHRRHPKTRSRGAAFFHFKPKEKEKTISIAEGEIHGTVQGMGAATKGGKYHWSSKNKTDW